MAATNNFNTRDVNGASRIIAAYDTTQAGGPIATQHIIVDPTNTYTMPTGDAIARSIFVAAGDGTNPFLSSSLANLQAYTGNKAMLVASPGSQIGTANIVTGTVTPDASLGAPGAGKIYNVNLISITLAATANQPPLHVELIQDAAGSPAILWQGDIAALANTMASIILTDLSIPQTVANKSLDLKVTSGTIVSTNYISCNIGASISQ